VPLWWIALQFAACSAVILLAGVRLSRYGDVIAARTGMGGTWFGLVAMAAVTSLPELITGASSVALFDVPDIAAGDAIGSCMFNLVILALLDVRDPQPLTARIHQGHVLSAAFGIVLLGLAALAIQAGGSAPAFGWVALHSLVFIAAYAFAIRIIFSFERSRMSQLASEVSGVEDHRVPLRRAVRLYVVNAIVLVAAAAYLPFVGEALAAATGLEQSFVGSLFIATSTSLPEIVVSVAAARIGAIDMAAGNLFGSNLFNIAVLGVDDLFYTRGPLLAAVSPSHLVTLTAAMMMTAVAVVGLTYRAQRKRHRLSWDTFGIVAIYVGAIAMLSGTR
jgi:cation:H+ antiporter